MFATTAVIIRQEIVEIDFDAYLLKIPAFGVIVIFVVAKNMKLMSRTARAFRPMNAVRFVCASIAKSGLASAAPPLTPATVVTRSAAPRRARAKQMVTSNLVMVMASAGFLIIDSAAFPLAVLHGVR